MDLEEFASEGWKKLKKTLESKAHDYLDEHPKVVEETAKRMADILLQHISVIRSGAGLSLETNYPSGNNHPVLTIIPTSQKGADDQGPLGALLAIEGAGCQRVMLQPTGGSRARVSEDWAISVLYAAIGELLSKAYNPDDTLTPLHKEDLRVIVHGNAGQRAENKAQKPATKEEVEKERQKGNQEEETNGDRTQISKDPTGEAPGGRTTNTEIHDTDVPHTTKSGSADQAHDGGIGSRPQDDQINREDRQQHADAGRRSSEHRSDDASQSERNKDSADDKEKRLMPGVTAADVKEAPIVQNTTTPGQAQGNRPQDVEVSPKTPGAGGGTSKKGR